MVREVTDDKREQILRRLRSGATATVRELSEELGVTAVTVHRHLARLEADGIIARPRGSARLLSGAALDLDFDHRLAAQADRKIAIARRAVEFVPTDGAVFVDASTTCYFAVREIERRVGGNLTVVTSSPAVLRTFQASSIRVVATPGELDTSLRAILGPWTIEFLEGLNLETALISGVGINLESGLMTSNRQLADLLQHVVKHCQRVYVLIDSSKFGRIGLLNIVDPSEVAGVITDSALPAPDIKSYRAKGVNLIIAEN